MLTAQPLKGRATILNFQADRLFKERSYCRLLFYQHCYHFGSFLLSKVLHIMAELGIHQWIWVSNMFTVFYVSMYAKLFIETKLWQFKIQQTN